MFVPIKELYSKQSVLHVWKSNGCSENSLQFAHHNVIDKINVGHNYAYIDISESYIHHYGTIYALSDGSSLSWWLYNNIIII